jgi:hypothetical protein
MYTRPVKCWRTASQKPAGQRTRLYRAAITSLEFMSMVMVHPEVP